MINPILFQVIDKESRYYGYKGKIQPNNIIRDNSQNWNVMSLLPNEWERYVDNICDEFNYKIVKYPINTQDKITVITNNGLGNFWTTTIFHILSDEHCPQDIKASFGERCLIEIFKLNNIEFKYQNTIHHSDGYHQFMDFYLPDYNMCIEYNGIQHYEKTSRKDLQYQHSQDLKKYKYCINNNIQWSEIPYIYNTIDKIVEYVSNKVLFRHIKRPSNKTIHLSKLYDEQIIINEYKKVKSSYSVATKFNIERSTVLNILKRHDIKRFSDKKPVIQFSKSLELIAIYPSATCAGKEMGNKYRQVNISAACRGKHDIIYGYKWLYLDDYQNKHPEFTDKMIEKYMIKEGDYID
jgi:hypothetical protein